MSSAAGRAPDRPKLALRPSKPAQAGLEPRPTYPAGGGRS
jgi:hypothetical protein